MLIANWSLLIEEKITFFELFHRKPIVRLELRVVLNIICIIICEFAQLALTSVKLEKVTFVITLTLMHPTQSVPVQSWTFESESVIRIGRANDNDVVIYSAVVSRHHVELWKEPSGWEIINFGANGTYVNSEPIVQKAVEDGTIFRLGNSGPLLQVALSEDEFGKARVKTQDGKPGKPSAASEIDARQDEETIITFPESIIEEKIGGEDDVTMFDFE